MEYLNPVTALSGLQDFFRTGRPVLFAIGLAAFAMFAFIMERLAYYSMAHKPLTASLLSEWNARPDRRSWRARAVRDALISTVRSKTETSVGIIKTLVAIAPLLGLLGTVWGMIEVFDVMALSGSSNAKAMAGGVFKATIPTMAGMVVALVGLFFSNYVERKGRRETARFADKIEIA
jgi:biopolymer transport protein ExbB